MASIDSALRPRGYLACTLMAIAPECKAQARCDKVGFWYAEMITQRQAQHSHADFGYRRLVTLILYAPNDVVMQPRAV